MRTDTRTISRRDLLIHGSAALAGLARAFPSRPGEEVIPFLEQPQPPSPELNLLNWAELDAWITPNEQFFRVVHYNKPLGPAIDHLHAGMLRQSSSIVSGYDW
jgi:hypothetical protein